MKSLFSTISAQALLRSILIYGLMVSLTALAQQVKATGQSGILEIVITEKISPALGGRIFGQVGTYDLILGRANAVADPMSTRNTGVVDLKLAPRNSNGLVEYSFDVAFLKPTNPTKANGVTVVEVTNRGRPILQTSLLRGRGNLNLETGAGEDSILEQGYTLAWTGWQADIAAAKGILTASYPVAIDSKKSIIGRVRDEIALDGSAGAQIAPVTADAKQFDVQLYYPLANGATSVHQVTVQQRADDMPTILAPTHFSVIGVDRLRIDMQPNMDRGALYSVDYSAKDPKVMGLAFTSFRDLATLLRQESKKEIQTLKALQLPPMKSVIATGLSQSARFIRDFVYQDFNINEYGRIAFDGVIPQGSGGKRGFFNQRFAQPGPAPDFQHEMRGYPGANFPFAYLDLKDPVSGRTEGILTRCTGSRSCPKIIHLDSEWEQWQQAGSLIGSDLLGRSIGFPTQVRAYLIASTPHASLPPNAGVKPVTQPPSRAICEQILNPLTWAPVLRASVANMDKWIKGEMLPPESKYPTGSEQGRVSIETLKNMFPTIPGYAFSTLYGKLQVVNFQENPPKKISSFAPYAVQMMRVNSDGNGVDGVVLPEVAVPIATYSGRNTRAAGFAQGELCHTLGSYMPFTKTRAERDANGDSRLSIQERYSDNSDYQARLRKVAQQLVSERLMLPTDAKIYESFTLP